ncbi:hypothetical protein, partial [uncultured Campylobacter sp.]|uniref:hypothetical protein n=1 Tax=uncultured Campylobacter sp. TaxID=218934 RepID=UPI00262B8D3E
VQKRRRANGVSRRFWRERANLVPFSRRYGYPQIRLNLIYERGAEQARAADLRTPYLSQNALADVWV